jgi:hypothetical protein
MTIKKKDHKRHEEKERAGEKRKRGEREGRKKLDLPLIHLELQGVSPFFFTNLNRAPSPQAQSPWEW